MKVTKILFLAFLVLFGCPTSAMALTSAERYRFAQDGILFVDTCTDPPISPNITLTTSSATGTSSLAASQVQFVETYHDIAVTLSTSYGIPWETVMAQGILESAAGTSSYAVNRNNFFGIGAYDSNPDNAYSYATPMEGWEGYYKNIVNTSVYRANGVFSTTSPYGNTVTDPIAYANAIKAAGYATDPDYVSKLTSLINGINDLAKSRSWPSSAEIAASNPVWFTNAEKYRQGASPASSSTSSAQTALGTISLANGCPASSSAVTNASSTGVTTTTFEGQTIAFPIAMATKENISGSGFLSDLPCNDSIGCHYGAGVPAGLAAAAFDICFKDSAKCEGTTPGTYGNTDSATVVSITGGTITKVYYERNGATCNHVIIRNSLDNTSIAYMHMLYEPDIKEGVDVSAGDVIGHVSSLSPCHDDSTPHVHIDKASDPSITLGPTQDIRDPKLTEIINAAYAALPANDAELSSRIAADASSSTLKSGGMTLEEARKFMFSYITEAARQLRGDYYFENAFVHDSDCINGTLNNCSAFTQWFLNRYTTLGPSGANIWQGSEAVSQYVSHGQLVSGGKVPRAYAVVSMGPYTGTADGWPNHTAIVLGINAERDEIILGEAGCSANFVPNANVYSLSEYTNSPSPYGPTYAYTDAVLKGLN